MEALKDKITLGYGCTASVWWNDISGYLHATWALTRNWEKSLREEKKKKRGQNALQEWLCNRKLLNNSADKVWAREEFICLSQSSPGVTGVESSTALSQRWAGTSFSAARQGKVEITEVTRTFAIDCWGRQNFTLGGDLLSKTLPLGHASSSKANHLSVTFLLLSFTCFYMSNSKLGPVHFFIFPVFFFLKEGIWPQRTAAYWIMLLCVKASVFSTLKLLQI